MLKKSHYFNYVVKIVFGEKGRLKISIAKDLNNSEDIVRLRKMIKVKSSIRKKFERYFKCKVKDLVYIVAKARYEMRFEKENVLMIIIRRLKRRKGTNDIYIISDLYAEEIMGIFVHQKYPQHPWRIA